jgi:hypothetical protein
MTLSDTPGPAIQPASALLEWFEGPGKGRLVQVPVVVVPSPLGLASGYVAGAPAADASGALSLKLDDTAMSVSLADNIRPDCAYDEPCAIWVEGYWGATLAMPGPSFGGPDFGGPATDTPKRHPFSVRRYVGRVTTAAPNVRLVAKTP